MALSIREIHAAPDRTALNQEWWVVENVGDRPFSTAGCSLSVARGSARPRQIGTLDPGFSLAPGERVRVITGAPSKKSQGAPPAEDGARNYHLFMSAPVLNGAGTVLVLALRQHELARAAFDPARDSGVAEG